MKWTISSKVGGLIIFSVLIFGFLGIISFQMISKLSESTKWNTHSYKVLENQEQVLSNLKDAETGQRGFIITNDKRYLEPYDSAVKYLKTEMEEGLDLTKDNPQQQKRIYNLKLLIEEKLKVIEANH